VHIPKEAELLERLRALPAARPLLERLADVEGVYLIGGGVRDLLLGGAPTDLDLVVEGDPEQVAERLGGAAVVHDRFGTSTVHRDDFTYDIARSRSESYEHPGALPEVAPAPLEEDLKRRDFTVNAIAIALGGERAGAVTAAPQALADLEARQLRVLHDRSFIDDPTRLLRLVRYAGRLRFEIEPRTRSLLDAAARSGALSTASGARVGAELRLLAREPDPLAALEMLHELGLDQAIEPGFGLTEPDLARRALALLPDDGRRDLLAIAIAARGLAQPRFAALLDQLAFEAGDRDVVLAVARAGEALARALERAKLPSEIAAAVGNATPELIALAGALGAERAAVAWLERLRHVRLEIDGRDLLAAGVPEGPAIGRGLRAALYAKLDGRVAGAEDELEAALQAARD
jgi:tRNA nucleotidyltransferase (CCA-adding enzyme)